MLQDLLDHQIDRKWPIWTGLLSDVCLERLSHLVPGRARGAVDSMERLRVKLSLKSRQQRRPLKIGEVARRIPKPVGMVDPDPGGRPFADQPEEQLVGGGEDFRNFLPDRGQLVDREEAAVVDLFGRDPPERQPERLSLDQLVERIERPWIPRRPVQVG